ncbi:hypothetical protein [Prosthecobacter sp.]|nr:hypothetical protein [Prosthecobacter sp.]MDI1311107.1 hypothetical protein [Prosthecobacter sp.]
MSTVYYYDTKPYDRDWCQQFAKTGMRHAALRCAGFIAWQRPIATHSRSI